MKSLAEIESWSVAMTSRVAAVGVMGILLIAFVTVLDVLLRWSLNSPIPGLNEISSQFLALGIAACLPAGFASQVHLRIEFIEHALPATAFAWLRAFGSVLLLVFASLLGWQLCVVALSLIHAGQVTAIWKWPEGHFLFGIGILMLLNAPIQLIVALAAVNDAFRRSVKVGTGVAVTIVAIVAVAVLFRGHLAGYTQWIWSLPSSSIALGCFLLMWFAVILAVPISAAIGLCGLLGTVVMLGTDPALSVVGAQARTYLTNDSLAVLPLFLLMGAFASVAGISSDIYRFANSAVGHWRGGLAHATIFGCAGFGALTGSSLATSATIGSVALPEMAKRGYAASLAAGTVAAGGTLGQLIPPSTIIVVYALLTEESIGRLFVAAIVPALLGVLLYLVSLSVFVRLKPSVAPQSERAPIGELVTSVGQSWEVFALIFLVLGGLYAGIFTETEAASVGAVGTFVIALLRRKITRHSVWAVMRETTTAIAMIYMLIFGAVIFSFFIGVSGLSESFLGWIQSITTQPIGIIICIILMYLVLGTVMDTIAIMVITAPVFAPIIVQMGYDPVWWAILTVVCVEVGMITPPFGLNIFVIKAINKDIALKDVYKGVVPFVAADLVKIVLLVLFPWLVLWLPSTR